MFLCPRRIAYSFLNVRQSVRLSSVRPSVCPSARNFNIAHNFCNSEDHSNLIYGLHVYLMEVHIFSKVKYMASKRRSRGHFVSDKHISCCQMYLFILLSP